VCCLLSTLPPTNAGIFSSLALLEKPTEEVIYFSIEMALITEDNMPKETASCIVGYLRDLKTAKDLISYKTIMDSEEVSRDLNVKINTARIFCELGIGSLFWAIVIAVVFVISLVTCCWCCCCKERKVSHQSRRFEMTNRLYDVENALIRQK
jgi:hypothetical protein